MKDLLQKFNSRNLLNIGLFVFILVLVSVVILEPGKDEAPKARHLTELKQADINHIELNRANEADIKLQKRNGIWYINAPYQLAANDYRALSISALAEVTSHLQYDVNKIDLKKFKLDKPEVSITLNHNTTLEIGGVDPIKNRRYVKNGDTLHLVSDTFYYQVVGKVTAYISYQILPPEIKLSKLELPKFSLNQQDGKWAIDPVQKDASADSINEFVNEWRHAQSLEISEYSGKLRKPNIRIFPKDQQQALEFRLQKENNSTFLIRNDLKLRYKLSDETAEKLQNLPEPPEVPEQPTSEAADNKKQVSN